MDSTISDAPRQPGDGATPHLGSAPTLPGIEADRDPVEWFRALVVAEADRDPIAGRHAQRALIRLGWSCMRVNPRAAWAKGAAR